MKHMDAEFWAGEVVSDKMNRARNFQTQRSLIWTVLQRESFVHANTCVHVPVDVRWHGLLFPLVDVGHHCHL